MTPHPSENAGQAQSETIDFALLGHPSHFAHLSDILLHSRPDYDLGKLRKYEKTLTKFFEWMPSYVAKTPVELPCGESAQTGRLLICTFMPSMLTSARQLVQAYNKVVQACRMAQDMGAKIVGLGGFTSIISGDQGAKLIDELGIAVTSGNSLTAAMALGQLDALLAQLDVDIAKCRVGLVGATGDIGRACTLSLAPRAGGLLLVARNRAKLQELSESLENSVDVHIATDVTAASDCQILLVATSSPEPILDEEALLPGTIVCDISYPKNLSYRQERSEDVLVFSGGLVQMPFELPIGYYTQLPRNDLIYGCFGEAIILTMVRRYESFSTGQGQITPEKMDVIRQLASQQGFRPAPLYRGHDEIDNAALQRFKKHLKMGK